MPSRALGSTFTNGAYGSVVLLLLHGVFFLDYFYARADINSIRTNLPVLEIP